MSLAGLKDIVDAVLSGKSRSYVDDARTLALAFRHDYMPMFENLTATQTRCTELLEELRYYKNPLLNPVPEKK